MLKARWILVSAFLLQQPFLHAANLRVRALYQSKMGIASGEVTVRSLDDKIPQLQRLATDADGWTKPFKLHTGFYQIKAACKGFMDSVEEVFIHDSTQSVVLDMQTRPIIEFALAGPSPVPLDPITTRAIAESIRHVRVQFVSKASGQKPIAQARVLYRNTDGSQEQRFTTDSQGGVQIVLPEGINVYVAQALVLFVDKKVYTFVLERDCNGHDSSGIFPRIATCVPINNPSTVIEVLP